MNNLTDKLPPRMFVMSVSGLDSDVLDTAEKWLNEQVDNDDPKVSRYWVVLHYLVEMYSEQHHLRTAAMIGMLLNEIEELEIGSLPDDFVQRPGEKDVDFALRKALARLFS